MGWFTDSRPAWRHLLRTGATALTVALVATAAPPAAFAAAPAKPQSPAVPKEKQLPYHRATPGAAPVSKPFAKYDPTVAAKLPGAGTAVVDLTGPGTGNDITARAGTLPVLVKRVAAASGGRAAANAAQGGPARVRVTTADPAVAEKAGVHGVLFSVTTEDGSASSGAAQVTVDPSSFRSAFGGDYAARLRLVQLPACALTTPELAQCQVQQPVPVAPGDPLTATVQLAAAPAVGGARSFAAPMTAAPAATGTVLAATSAADGSSGSYSATSLSPAGTWSAGGNTGSFNYSYPVKVPTAIAGQTPDISFSYNSSSQDGRTSGTNNQSSWLGDGWSSSESYVERSYKNCADDTSSGAPTGSGDKCWAGQVLTLSLNGQSTQIVYDGNTFRPAEDSATEKVEQLFGATNGSYNGEYFRVTENGTQYYFGLNQLPGWSAGKQTTQSVYTEPVYGAHTGDPCHGASFAASSCVQGWRWNLDYAVDLHSNAVAYYYLPETNYYGANAQNTGVAYTRGGYLQRIDYGMTAATVYSATAPEQIVFGTAERCLPGTPTGATCTDDQFTTANAAWWPDVPIDQNCAAGASCTNHAPSFWSRKRLTTITTQVQVNGATQQVDQYTMVHSFPDGGDHAPTLWLDSVQHTGLDTSAGGGSTPPMPVTSFDPPAQLPNRVGTIANMPVMYHDRIQTVTTETGAQITVAYNPTECTPANVPADPSTNTKACFPVLWTPMGYTTQQADWFHKYTVYSVLTQDKHTANQDGTYPELLTTYTYLGGAGWHYDDSELAKAATRTFAQFRGYGTVETRTGDTAVFHLTNGAKVNDQLTLSRTSYFRGLSHNTADGTGGSTVSLTSQDLAHTVEDVNALAGRVFETDSYTGDGGTVDRATVTVPTVLGPTATRTRTGLSPLTAQMVRTANSYTSQAVSYGQRKTETDTFYDTTLGRPTTGMPVQVDDRGEPTAAGNVAKCTWTRYVENPALTLVLPAETMTNAQDCTTPGATQTGPLVSDSRTSYDGNAFTWDGATGGTAPVKGEATRQEKASASSGSTATNYLTLSQASYDSLGRPSSVVRTPNSTAPDGSSLAKTTTTSYTPAGGGLVTGITVQDQVTAGTSPTYQTTTTSLYAARGLPMEKLDPANNRTSFSYDALGRQTAVWLPTQSKAAGDPATLTFGYAVSTTVPSAVTTGKLQENGGYQTSVTLYDAMLRKRQSQVTAPNASMNVTDTQYDSHGWTVLTNNAYNLSGAPAATAVKVAQASVPDTTVTEHDAMGRATASYEMAAGQTPPGMNSATVYTGDTTLVVPRAGGVVSRTATDARGQTTELDQYTAAPTIGGSATGGWTATGGSSQATGYSYTAAGQQSTVTGTDGSVWTTVYDLLGRKVQVTDPDQGTSKSGYDDAGNLSWTKDARGVELDYSYDLLGRKVKAVDKNNNNFTFGVWKWDSVQAGKLSWSARYVPGVSGGYFVQTTGYTSMGKPTGTRITLPASEAPLPTSYSVGYSYSTVTQQLTDVRDPGYGGLLVEDVLYNYDVLGNPTSMQSSNAYVGPVQFYPNGEVSKITYGASSTNQVWSVFQYEPQLRRLQEVQTSRSAAPGPMVDDVSYTYDPSGNRTSTQDKQSESGNTVTDTQCYQFDALNRLAQAWTATGACPSAGTNPTSGTVAGGPAAYWQSYGYDALGDRSSETDHAVNGQSGDTVTTYTNGCTGTTVQCPNGPQPHTLTATSTAGPTGTSSTAFSSNAIGATASRTPSSGPGQTLHWDDEGHLDQITPAGATVPTQYVYDADGNQLIRRDPGKTTLFAGDTEVVIDTSASPATVLGAVRTYSLGGLAVAVSSTLPGGGTDYLLSDPQGTGTLMLDTTTQVASRKQYTPYGQNRGTTSTSWIDPTRGFLAKPADPATGYTDVGARKYDPSLGRFISGDPVFQASDPQQLGGYTYAASNPVTHSDPSGLRVEDDERIFSGPSVPEQPDPCGGHVCFDQSTGKDNGDHGSHYYGQDFYDKALRFGFNWKEFGAQRALYSNLPIGEDNGIIMVRFFIQDPTAVFGVLRGDNRGFSNDPAQPNRMQLFWNTATGEASFTVEPSHMITGHDIDAKELVSGREPSYTEVIKSDKNYVNIPNSTGSYMKVDVSAINSLIRVFPVQAAMQLGFGRDGHIWFERQGTAYPSVEVVQYRRGEPPRVIARDSSRWHDVPNNFLDPGINASPALPNTDHLYLDGKCVAGC